MNLKLKRDDPPELTEFLESVLQEKDEFKKIRVAANNLQRRPYPSSINLNNVSPNEQDDSHSDTTNVLIPVPKANKHLKRNIYSASNHQSLKRNLGRPINDVYPYLYDANEQKSEIEQDEREERSSWKDVKERKPSYSKNKQNRMRYRRGLDLNDYSSDNDFGLSNIKVMPRSRSGVRIVPGNKYEQRRGVPTNFDQHRKRQQKPSEWDSSDRKSFPQILENSPYAERAIPDDYPLEHDILGFKAEARSTSNSKKYKKLNAHNRFNEENNLLEGSEDILQNRNIHRVSNKKSFKSHSRDKSKTQTKNEDREKRSMKLNVIDDNNLIKNIKKDSQSVILTLKVNNLKERGNPITTDNPNKNQKNLCIPLPAGESFEKFHKNPSNVINLQQFRENAPQIINALLKQNFNIKNEKDKNPSGPDDVAIVYEVDQRENDRENPIESPVGDEKKNMLQDVDEPTSAIEQHELSTIPYIITLPKNSDFMLSSSFDVLRAITEFPEALTSSTSHPDQFIVKESKDMVHGKSGKGLLVLEKRGVREQEPKVFKASKDNLSNTKSQKPALEEMSRPKRKKSNNYDYDDTIDNFRNKLDDFKEFFSDHDSVPENQLIEELSNFKRDASRFNKNQLSNIEDNQDNDYYNQEQRNVESQTNFQSRKLQSFNEDKSSEEVDSKELISKDTRFGNLNNENEEYNRMSKTDFIENKNIVKRGLVDLFGMTNDEDYAEDLDDYKSSKKIQRSDDSYEEEGDSAVSKTQTYVDKKKTNESKVDDKLKVPKNDDNDYTIGETFSKVTTDCSSAKGELPKSKKIEKLNFNTTNSTVKENATFLTSDSMANVNKHSNDLETNNDLKVDKRSFTSRCDKCKSNKKSKPENKNCNICCKSGTNKNCNCLKENGDVDKSESIKIEEKDTEEDDAKLERSKRYDLENRNNVQENIENQNGKFNNTIENTNSCDKNITFHPKTVTSTELSKEKNQKLVKEETNAESDLYQFDNPKHACNPCNDSLTNPNTTQTTNNNTINKCNPGKHNGKIRKHLIQNTAEKVESVNLKENSPLLYEENVGYAHHPLRGKKPHNKQICDQANCPPHPDPKIDILNRFHTKHDQNEFNRDNQKLEHEVLPELETVKNVNLEQNDSNPKLSFQGCESENNDVGKSIQKKKEVQEEQVQSNEDEGYAEFSLHAQTLKGNKMDGGTKEHGDTEKRQFQENEDGNYIDFSLQANKLNLTKNIGKEVQNSDSKNDLKPTERMDSENKLLNSVDSFVDIVEGNENDKKLNKRQTSDKRVSNKLLISNDLKDRLDKDMYYLETINGDINDAPFEKFSKLNLGYWKKHPGHDTKGTKYSQSPYKVPYFQKNADNPRQLYPGVHLKHNKLNRAWLPRPEANNFRRVRRDHYSKIPSQKTDNDFLQKLPKTEEDNDRNSKKVQRKTKDCKGQPKIKIKEWINPNTKNKNKDKNCLLSEDKGLNPNFGLKQTGSKGGCNYEAEAEKGSKDYGQMHDALNGHLSASIVQTIYKKTKQHQQLRNRFSKGLHRKHGYKSEMKDLNAFRNTETEGDIKHTEELLHQIMDVLNRIILDQVRKRTCKHLSPELQKYLASITNLSKMEVEEDARIAEEGFPLPLVKNGKMKERPVDTEQGDFLFVNPDHKPELQQDAAEIRKKMKMIRTLLEKYKHMSAHCRTKVEDVEAYLKRHLCLLKKILKQIKKEEASEKKAGNDGFQPSNKLKRNKNYGLPLSLDLKRPNYAYYTKQDLINKQLENLGLGPSKTYKPTINLDKMIQDNIKKMKFGKLHPASKLSKVDVVKSKSSYRNEVDLPEEFEEDYENPKNERKREVTQKENKDKPMVSKKYRKLVLAAQDFRKKRAVEERLGKLFGETDKRSVKNENYETIKSLNIDNQDFSHAGFETPMVISLKK